MSAAGHEIRARITDFGFNCGHAALAFRKRPKFGLRCSHVAAGDGGRHGVGSRLDAGRAAPYARRYAACRGPEPT